VFAETPCEDFLGSVDLDQIEASLEITRIRSSLDAVQL
jgi:hypothetical protein